MIDARDVLTPLAALRNAEDIDTKKLAFNYFPGEQKGDFPSLDLLVPVLSKKAWNVLEPLAAPYCHRHQIHIRDEEYTALSVHHIVDCLDEEKSELKYFSGNLSKRHIMVVYRLALIDKKIDGAPIFRIKELEGKGVYLSDEFMAAVDAHNLQGLLREQVWPPLQDGR